MLFIRSNKYCRISNNTNYQYINYCRISNYTNYFLNIILEKKNIYIKILNYIFNNNLSIILIIWSLYISLFQSNDVQQKKTTFTIYRNISTILFSLYIIYDTYTILSFDYDGDFVTAAFDYYMDIFTVFKNLLMNTED